MSAWITLKCCGIDAVAMGEEYSDLPLNLVHDLYDSFEDLVEAFLPTIQRMTVSLIPAGVRIAMEAGPGFRLPETKLPVTCQESDGCLFLTIQAEGGDGR